MLGKIASIYIDGQEVKSVYVFSKHVHATKLFDILIVIPSFRDICTCLAFNSIKKFARP